MWRHPLISSGACLILVFGFVYDAMQEILLVRTQLYIYSQVIPFGSIFTGKPYQFPLLWESSAGHVGDDSRRCPAVPRRHRPHGGREAGAADRASSGNVPRSARSLVMFLILNVALLSLYGGMLRRPSGGAEAPPRSPARGHTRRPRSTTPRASTKKPGNPARTFPESGADGNRRSQDGPT